MSIPYYMAYKPMISSVRGLQTLVNKYASYVPYLSTFFKSNTNVAVPYQCYSVRTVSRGDPLLLTRVLVSPLPDSCKED